MLSICIFFKNHFIWHDIYLFKEVKVCWKLTIKTQNVSDVILVVFILNFEHTWHFFLVFLLWIWNSKCFGAVFFHLQHIWSKLYESSTFSKKTKNKFATNILVYIWYIFSLFFEDGVVLDDDGWSFVLGNFLRVEEVDLYFFCWFIHLSHCWQRKSSF